LLASIAIFSGCTMQSKALTDGNERYYDESKSKVIEQGFFGENIYADLKKNILLVRLDQDDIKLAAWIKDGHIERANKLRTMYNKRNEDVVKAFNKYYKADKFLFYYAGDADKIFREKNLGYLYKDLNQKAELTDLEKAYVLIYRTTPELKEGKRFILHHWDGEKVERVKGHYNYREFKNFVSPVVDYNKTIRKFSDIVWN